MNALLSCQTPADSWLGPSEVWRVIKPACAVTILPNQPWRCLYLPRRPNKKLGHPPSSSLPTPRQPGSHQAELILTLKDVLKLFSHHCQDISSQFDYAVPCTEKFFHLLVNVNDDTDSPNCKWHPFGDTRGIDRWEKSALFMAKHGNKTQDLMTFLSCWMYHTWGHISSRLTIQGEKFCISQADFYWGLTFPIVKIILTQQCFGV